MHRRETKKPGNAPVQGKGFPKAPLEKIPDERTRELIAKGRIGGVAAKGKAAVPALLEILRGEDKEAAKKASLALVKMGKEGVKAVFKHFERLASLGHEKGNPDYEEKVFLEAKEETAKALAMAGLPAISHLVKLLKDNVTISLCAAGALEKMGAAAIPPMVEILKGKDYDARFSAIMIVAKIGDKSAIPALADLFRRVCAKGGYEEKREIISAISELAEKNPDYGWDAKVALLLMEDLRNGDESEVRAAAHALGRIGEPLCVGALLDAFENKIGAGLDELPESIRGWMKKKLEEGNTRETIAEALALIAKKSPLHPWSPAIPKLTEMVSDKDAKVRMHAAAALHEIAGEGASDCKSAIPNLVRALMDKDDEVVRNVLGALHEIAERNPNEVAEELVNAVNGALGDRLK